MKYLLVDEKTGDEYALKFETYKREIEKAVKLTNDTYKLIRKELEPLPNKFYVDRKDGKCFSQWHLRGILPEDYKAFKKGEKSFQEIIIGRSLHQDLRYKLKGLDKLVQYVITESSMESYVRMMKGELNPEQKGAPNVQKAKILSKPSGEPTEEWLKRHTVKSEAKGALIDKKGAKIVDKYIMHNKSYWLKPGQVGSTPYTYAYLGTIWTGEVKEGTSRSDLHELFMYPDKNLPNENKELFDGRFIIRCFKGTDNRPNTWWIWKATTSKFPLNPYCSIDAGFHYLIPAEDVKKIGHAAYSEWTKRKVDCK